MAKRKGSLTPIEEDLEEDISKLLAEGDQGRGFLIFRHTDRKFVQFALEDNGLVMDLPMWSLETDLTSSDVEELLRSKGFTEDDSSGPPSSPNTYSFIDQALQIHCGDDSKVIARLTREFFEELYGIPPSDVDTELALHG